MLCLCDSFLTALCSVTRAAEQGPFTRIASFDTPSMLFHATKACNVLGILSHGLLPPLVAESQYGVTRTDAGMLGRSA